MADIAHINLRLAPFIGVFSTTHVYLLLRFMTLSCKKPIITILLD